MKNSIKNSFRLILPLTLTLVSVLAFKVGDHVELENFLNTRTTAQFKGLKNVATKLSKGTHGKVVETKKMPSGNYGIKMKVKNGPHSGESYWVYHNLKKSQVKLTDAKAAEVKIDSVKLPEIKNAELTADHPGYRAPEEQVVINAATDASRLLDIKNVSQILPSQTSPECAPQIEPGAVSNNRITATSPASYVAAAESEPLKFVGKILLDGHDSVKSCIFQNSKVYVVYEFCLNSKKEAPALGMTIISRDGGMMNFYVENSEAKGLVSQTKRSDYDRSWRIGYKPSPAIASNPDPAAINSYISAEKNKPACFVGGVMMTTGNPNCRPGISDSEKTSWLQEGNDYWNNPDDAWYSLQKNLLLNVKNTP